MAEGRFISKSISTSGQLKRVSLEADFLFGRMIPHADRDGRLDGDPDVVKAMAVPLRGEFTPELISTCLSELDAVGLIEWYEVDQEKVVWFPGFREHQRGMKPERERASRLKSHESQGVRKVRRTSTGGVPEPSVNVAPTLAPNVSEVKVSKGKLSKEKVPADAGGYRVPAEKYDALYSVWAPLFGPMDTPTFRKKLKPIFDPKSPQYALEDVQNGMRAAKEWYVEQDDRDQRFWGLDQFVKDLSVKWIPFGKMPTTLHGELTERGAWAGSKAMREAARNRPRLAS